MVVSDLVPANRFRRWREDYSTPRHAAKPYADTMDRRQPKPIRRGWNYIPKEKVVQHVPEEVSTTPWALARVLVALDIFYTFIELVIFYAVVNTTALLTEVLNYSSKVVWYAVNFSYHVARYAVQQIVRHRWNGQPKTLKKVKVKPMPKPTPPELVQIPVVPKEDNKVEVNKVEVNKVEVNKVVQIPVKPSELIQIPVIPKKDNEVEFNEVEVKPTEVVQIPVNITPTEFVPEVTVKPTEVVQISVNPKVDAKPTSTTPKTKKNKQENRQNHIFYQSQNHFFFHWQKLSQSISTKLQFWQTFKSRYKLIT